MNAFKQCYATDRGGPDDIDFNWAAHVAGGGGGKCRPHLTCNHNTAQASLPATKPQQWHANCPPTCVIYEATPG